MTPPDRAAPSGVDRWFPVALVVAAAAVRLPWLGTADLWTDEIHTIEALGGSVGDTVSERMAAGHLPVYFLLMKAWAAVGGTESQFALRVPSALLGVACAIPALVLFRRLLAPAPARWAAALLVLHPLWVGLSREARMYPLLMLCLLVLLEGVVAARRSGRVPLRLWAAVLVGPLVHATWGIGLAAVTLWGVERIRRDRVDGGARTPRGVGMALAVSWVLLAAGLLLADGQHQELARRSLPREVAVFLMRHVAGEAVRAPLAPLYAMAGAAWLAVVWEGVRHTRRAARDLALWLIVGVPLLAVGIGVAASVPWGPVRYTAAATVGLALLAGCGAARSGWIYRGALVAAVALTLGAATLGPPTHWSDAARSIREGRRPEAPVLAADGHTAMVLSHYLGRPVHAAGTLPPEAVRSAGGYWCAGTAETPHWVEPGAEGAHSPPDDR